MILPSSISLLARMDGHFLTVTLPMTIVTVCLARRGIFMEDQGGVFHAPTSANVTVMRKRPREYLMEAEIERLMAAARDNRHGHCDATAILVAYRHALRSSELVSLRWDDVDFRTGRLHVRRAKGGETPSVEFFVGGDLVKEAAVYEPDLAGVIQTRSVAEKFDATRARRGTGSGAGSFCRMVEQPTPPAADRDGAKT
jgi:hypothetical protein